MQFYRLEHARDRELELVRPAAVYVDEMMTSCQHPQSWGDQQTAWTRQQLLDFVNQHPDGFEPSDAILGQSPAYYFWLRLRPETRPVVPFAGTLSFRFVETDQVRLYSGHIGYGVFAPARGNHLAERAVRLILPLARKHGLDHLWITCNPDNLASRRTCERLGATLVETIDIPPTNYLYTKGDRQKCRYRLAV